MNENIQKYGSLLIFIVIMFFVLFHSNKKPKTPKPQFPTTVMVENYTDYKIDTLAKKLLYNVLGYDSIAVDFI